MFELWKSYFWSSCLSSAMYFSISLRFCEFNSLRMRANAYPINTPITYRHLCCLRYPPLKLLSLDPLFQHCDLVTIELLDAVHDQLLLDQLLLLGFSKGALFLEELILLEI